MEDRSIVWCLKQKRGIRVIRPNENLVKEYIRKAKGSLNTMNAALQINETEWTLTTAYYARYFALYALLMKLGVKSEIHDCSIAVARLLARNEILTEELVDDVSQAKETRVDVQYYVAKEIEQGKIRRNVESAHKFVLEIERIIENITTKQIEFIRSKIESMKP